MEPCLWPGQGEIANRNLYILNVIYILFLFNKKKSINFMKLIYIKIYNL